MLKQFVTLLVAVALASRTLTAQPGGPVATRVRVTRDGGRIAGHLVAVDDDALTLVPDGTGDPIRIPLSSIAATEVSAGKRSRLVADLAGIGVGFGDWSAFGKRSTKAVLKRRG